MPTSFDNPFAFFVAAWAVGWVFSAVMYFLAVWSGVGKWFEWWSGPSK
jgi:hypothetical protein